ncbi:phosphoglycerate kinase [Marinitoga hydrogenitolerans DSM 16785]|uniref:Phosphoglycerate kinase n=1 Tax=Marinitoga hydrogenitolerans (strain DSM 16785 / JCM 12826 / AT1271) TaxID=1122195 RepID=A0A1M4SHK0_MARH1|nr:phosphoglycerate kinase [Marinitoga hydrogenitolerans]SHE31669.1 phosphoglycerate kinase [Marinitoga hydrogenitolerans DSM 16785]
MKDLKINTLDDFDFYDKTVILRVDINSPLDPKTKKIVNENRINKVVPTIKELLNKGAKLAIIAHQGDSLDYFNLIPLEEHAKKLSEKIGAEIKYIDDVAGPAAQNLIKNLKKGEAILLGNLRYLSEEISTFEDTVKLSPKEMLNTFLIRHLAPLGDIYVNEAFSAAHRNAPSMVAFEELLPTAGGRLLISEINALSTVMKNPQKPSIFVLGGLKVSDAFGMMKQVLENGTADKILTCGVTGIIMHMSLGKSFGKKQEKFIYDRSLNKFFEPAKEFMKKWGDKFINPIDFAYENNGKRIEVSLDDLPVNDALFLDIGTKTIELFKKEINNAKTIFVNGPAGAYDQNKNFEKGTYEIWNAIADSNAYSVIGGGDSVSAAHKLVKDAEKKFSYICTAGGAMVRFLSGKELPLIKALKKAYRKR